MILEWDPAKAAANRRKHGVEFSEAGTVLDDPLSFTVRDPRSVDEVRSLTIVSFRQACVTLLDAGGYAP